MISSKTTAQIVMRHNKICEPLDFGQNCTKEINDFQSVRWVRLDDVKQEWTRLMDRTDNLHGLECGSCDDAVRLFTDLLFVRVDEQEHKGLPPLFDKSDEK